MASDISGVGAAGQSSSPVSTLGAPRKQAAGAAQGGPPAHAAAVTGPKGNAYGYYAKRQDSFLLAVTAQDQRLEEAIGLRQAQVRLGEVQGLLGIMQTGLEDIVKQYPPYQAADSSRIQLINQITGLRKQIEALTFPVKASGAAEAVQKLGLLPDKAPQDITDAELGKLLGQVGTAQEMVAQAQASMWVDMFGPDSPSAEHEAAVQINQARDTLAGTNLPISRFATVLANLS